MRRGGYLRHRPPPIRRPRRAWTPRGQRLYGGKRGGHIVDLRLQDKTALVAWQSSIDRLLQVGSPSRYAVWFEEKEISHGQISRYPHGGGTQCAAENGVVG